MKQYLYNSLTGKKEEFYQLMKAISECMSVVQLYITMYI